MIKLLLGALIIKKLRDNHKAAILKDDIKEVMYDGKSKKYILNDGNEEYACDGDFYKTFDYETFDYETFEIS